MFGVIAALGFAALSALTASCKREKPCRPKRNRWVYKLKELRRLRPICIEAEAGFRRKTLVPELDHCNLSHSDKSCDLIEGFVIFIFPRIPAQPLDLARS